MHPEQLGHQRSSLRECSRSPRTDSSRYPGSVRSLLLAVILCVGMSACGADRPEPTSASGRVSWTEAQHLLKGCRVRALGQTHSRVVTLKFVDGKTATSREPKIDQIFHLLSRLPRDCRPHTVATE